jgi:prepilin-type N-terminal cleavage/methylation domain-containing protein
MPLRRVAGFTLIELVVAIAVLAILAVLVIPSFADFRDRAALRGAADQLTTFWGDARFEALRRDSLVKVGFNTTSGGAMCIGAQTTTDPADDDACDCFTAGACNVGAYPAVQTDWKRIRPEGQPTLGDTDGDDNGVAVIDPKRGTLTQSGDAGRMSLQGTSEGRPYRLDVVIDRNGRAIQCEPSAAAAKIPAFTNRRC